jgi:hypothetical protein
VDGGGGKQQQVRDRTWSQDLTYVHGDASALFPAGQDYRLWPVVLSIDLILNLLQFVKLIPTALSFDRFRPSPLRGRWPFALAKGRIELAGPSHHFVIHRNRPVATLIN